MVIQFGDWRLVPGDGDNWELAHRHISSRGKNKGKVSWHRVGRYYQKSTLANAIEYAADWDLRNGEGGIVTLDQYIKAYADTLERHRAAFVDSVQLG